MIDLTTVFFLPDVSHASIAEVGKMSIIASHGGVASIDNLYNLRFRLLLGVEKNATAWGWSIRSYVLLRISFIVSAQIAVHQL